MTKIQVGKLYVNIYDCRSIPRIYCVTKIIGQDFIEFVWMQDTPDAEQKYGDPKYLEETAVEVEQWIKLVEEGWWTRKKKLR